MECPPPNGVVGLVEIEGLGNVPLSQHDCPGVAQARHDPGVGFIAKIPPSTDAERRAHPADGETLLDAHRHAGKRPSLPIGQLTRFLCGGAEALLDEGVEAAVMGPAAFDVGGNDIRDGSRPAGHRSRDLHHRITPAERWDGGPNGRRTSGIRIRVRRHRAGLLPGPHPHRRGDRHRPGQPLDRRRECPPADARNRPTRSSSRRRARRWR